MDHPKQHITDLAVIFRQKGVARIVISPGSRSAPLIRVFYDTFGSLCHSIVDERSAAYYALGMALFLQKPVALICTSGTAVLNYAPALAEAYYQKVPLLAVTADRPREWVDQQDNQTLRQSGIFGNYCKGSYDLPQAIHNTDDLWYAHRMINEAVELCSCGDPGPVHLNVPLADPLYDQPPAPSANIRMMRRSEPALSLALPDELTQTWKAARRILIVHGQDHPRSGVAAVLPAFHRDPRIAIVAENIANIPGDGIISTANLTLSKNRGSSPPYPDLLLHSGGQVVSKALTGYLRRASDVACWRIGTEERIIDTFRLVTHIIPYPPALVYRALSDLISSKGEADYGTTWLSLAAQAQKLADDFTLSAPFSDLPVFQKILRRVPDDSLLVLGNSSIIRYAQLFPSRPTLAYFANRGVSGIDGCLSTAAGIAHASGKLTLALTGDLSFLYDSNALWNRELPANLKIVVVNNRGGGIFHILKGPAEHPGFAPFIEAHHPVNIHTLALAFGIAYFNADDMETLEKSWISFMQEQSSAALFEVKTDAVASAGIFRQLMDASRSGT